jgi:PTH1 family peptidyl-tRNA hydrolase
MKLIVGLGNPGPGYAGNRHNVGFRCIDYLSRKHGIPINKRRLRLKSLNTIHGSGEIAGTPVVLAKPRTYMNLSGTAVAQLVHRFDVSPGDIIVIYDDMDLPTGKIRIRPTGGAGGHNGVASIIASLGNADFTRIRIGIGRPDSDEVSYVLSDFDEGERKAIDEALSRAADAIRCILAEGLEAAMNRYN